MTSDARLNLSDVSHAYGNFWAVHEASLQIQAGQVHCLLGPSGSGKSTLLRLVAGLEHLQHGRISIQGVEVAGPKVHVRPEDRSIGFVFQDFALFPHLNVLKNVVFGMSRLPKTQQRENALELLARVGMDSYAGAMPHTLSGGQQQRVALARALARQPALMLLDEPFSGLDVRLREEVREATLSILRAADIATLMVTHDPREALNTGHEISVIRRGQIVQTGPPDEIYNRSVDHQVAEIFGPVNSLEGVVENGTVATVFGPVEARGFSNSTPVDILIRPEALHLERQPEAEGMSGVVTSTTSEGGTMLVHVRLERAELELRVLSLTRSSWQPGDRLSIGLEPGGAMIHARR